MGWIKTFIHLLKKHPIKQNNYKDTMKILTNNFVVIFRSRELDACVSMGAVKLFGRVLFCLAARRNVQEAVRLNTFAKLAPPLHKP